MKVPVHFLRGVGNKKMYISIFGQDVLLVKDARRVDITNVIDIKVVALVEALPNVGSIVHAGVNCSTAEKIGTGMHKTNAIQDRKAKVNEVLQDTKTGVENGVFEVHTNAVSETDVGDNVRISGRVKAVLLVLIILV